jgi:murein endopeptidase
MQRDDLTEAVHTAAARAADHEAAAGELRKQEQALKVAQEREKRTREALAKAREQLLQAAADELTRMTELVVKPAIKAA